MNILYLIGNGFDIAQGLKTSYQDFYNYLVTQKPINAVAAQMIQAIKGEEYEKWSDLELELGKFTAKVSDKATFEVFYFDLCSKLKKYLKDQVDTFNPETHIIEKYIRDLVRPDNYLTNRERQIYADYIRRFTDTRRIVIVSFNYTNVVDKCLDIFNSERILPFRSFEYKLGRLLNIHGTLETPYLLMGVNDESQISNPIFSKDEDVQDYLVKPKSNYELGTEMDDQVAGGIDNANLIIAMGLSFGATDQVWWKRIGQRLRQTTPLRIIIFAHEDYLPEDERLQQRIKRRIRRDFLSKCEIEVDAQSLYQENIMVCLNKGLFSPDTIIFNDERIGI